MTNDIEVKSSKKAYFIVFSSYLYAFTNELAISWASPVLKQLRSNVPSENPLGYSISTNEHEWLASLICLGYMAGLIPFCYLSTKFGRKYIMLSLGIIHIIAFILYTPQNLTCFFIGRILNGIASSVGFIIFPMYIAEICKDSQRGALLVSRQIFAGCGTLVAYVGGNYMDWLSFNVVSSIVPVFFVFSFSNIGIESPYYYVLNQRYDEARQAYLELHSLPDRAQTDEEIQEISRTVEITEGESLGALLKQKHIQKSISIVFVLFIFQQLTGFMAFATYTEIIVDSNNATIFIAFVVLVGSIFTTFFIDKFGRKFHLLISGVGIVLVKLTLVLYYIYLDPDFYPRVICITLFFLSFNLGLAFIPQVICAEILPQRIKFEVAAIAGTFGWGVAFLITKYYLQVSPVYMISGFLVCSIILLIIIHKFVPETKKQSLRRIQGILQIDADQRDD